MVALREQQSDPDGWRLLADAVLFTDGQVAAQIGQWLAAAERTRTRAPLNGVTAATELHFATRPIELVALREQQSVAEDLGNVNMERLLTSLIEPVKAIRNWGDFQVPGDRLNMLIADIERPRWVAPPNGRRCLPGRPRCGLSGAMEGDYERRNWCNLRDRAVLASPGSGDADWNFPRQRPPKPPRSKPIQHHQRPRQRPQQSRLTALYG